MILEYDDSNDLDFIIRNTPGLLDFILSVAKKKHIGGLIQTYGKSSYSIPVGEYKGTPLTDMNKSILKRLLTVDAFNSKYPSIYYSAEILLHKYNV